MYHDLSLPFSGDGAANRARLACLAAAGYDVVAFEFRPQVEGRISHVDRCSFSPISSQALSAASTGSATALRLSACNPLAATHSVLPCSSAQASPAPLRQLTRLTVSVADAVAGAALAAAAPITATYDLLAVEPKSERALAQACSSLDIDIITLPLTSKLPFKLRPNALAPALARGVVFEVCYGPGLEDPASLRWLISNVQALARCVRGKNIILSGGITDPVSVRPTLDAASLLGSVLKVSTAAARAHLTTIPAAAIAHSMVRRAKAAASAPVPFPISMEGVEVAAGAGHTVAAGGAAGGSTAAQGSAGASSSTGKRRRQLQMQASKRGHQPGKQLARPDIVVLPAPGGG